ncbi:MAG: type II toxin-antitoxin system RelE/ParE family toxin [Alphaproteobacteria bacterium]|nr:type II toxin-antitoxin system RelE/ParE family toxin [Alphaproteobacteria bacterium]
MVNSKVIEIYEDEKGNCPFTEWLEGLKDLKVKSRIINRLMRLELGQYGDYKATSAGVKELRFHFGSGYRIYFGELNGRIIILLIGGDKGSQDKDIAKAKVYWKDVQENRDGKV